MVDYDSSTDSSPPSSEEDDSTMGIPSSASIEEFVYGFKDMADYNDVIEVDNISLYGSDSEEDKQPIDPPKGQIPVPIIEPILPHSSTIQLPD